MTLSDVLWPRRRRRAIGSASGGPSAAAERLPAVVVGATELLLPPSGRARRSSDRLRTRWVYTEKMQFWLTLNKLNAVWRLAQCICCWYSVRLKMMHLNFFNKQTYIHCVVVEYSLYNTLVHIHQCTCKWLSKLFADHLEPVRKNNVNNFQQSSLVDRFYACVRGPNLMFFIYGWS